MQTTRSVSVAAVEQVYKAIRFAASSGSGPATVPELCSRLSKGDKTVRRAVAELQAARRIRVFYGAPAAGQRASVRGKTHYRYVTTR